MPVMCTTLQVVSLVNLVPLSTPHFVVKLLSFFKTVNSVVRAVAEAECSPYVWAGLAFA